MNSIHYPSIEIVFWEIRRSETAYNGIMLSSDDYKLLKLL